MRRPSTLGLRALGMLALIAALVVSSPVRAEPAVSSDRVLAVLEAHCPECRQKGGEHDAKIDLQAVADDPRLVVRRHPDASRAYQRLLAEGARSQPAPAEIEAVRDWIESLPARDAGCRDRALITPGDVEALIDRWVETVGVAEAADTRFVSLVHLWNACVPSARLTQFRIATGVMLTALARRREPIRLETLGEESALLAFRVSEFERRPPPGDDAALGEVVPGGVGGDAIPADWMATQFLTQMRMAADAPNGGAAGPAALDGAALLAVNELARWWTRDVDLVRAAAERGVTSRALSESLAQARGELHQDAMRLTHGWLTRPAWSRLARTLDGRTAPPGPPADPALRDDEIDVLLWTDKPFYRPRDLVTINATVGTACHLTLIGVDQDGKAIVLFPNELEPDNRVAPGVTIGVPGHDAGYQLRFDESGAEQIVAICQRTSRRPAGVDYDYEKQRFKVLGDWRTFLRTAPERAEEGRARENGEATRSRRRGRAASDPPPIDPDGPAVEGRAAITVTIDPGGS
jgi:hypothetical protein